MSSLSTDRVPSILRAVSRFASVFGMHVGIVRYRRRGRGWEKRFLLPFDIDLLAIAALLVLYAGRLAAFGADGRRLVLLCEQIQAGGIACPAPFPDWVVAALAAFSCLRLAAWSASEGEILAAAGLAGSVAMVLLPYEAVAVNARMLLLGIVACLAFAVAWQRADASTRRSVRP